MCETLINYGVNKRKTECRVYMEQDDFTSAGDHLDKRNHPIQRLLLETIY